jgi:hypothetical protein
VGGMAVLMIAVQLPCVASFSADQPDFKIPKRPHYDSTIFKKFSLRYNHQVVHPDIDRCMVPDDHVPVRQYHLVEYDFRSGAVSDP